MERKAAGNPDTTGVRTGTPNTRSNSIHQVQLNLSV